MTDPRKPGSRSSGRGFAIRAGVSALALGLGACSGTIESQPGASAGSGDPGRTAGAPGNGGRSASGGAGVGGSGAVGPSVGGSDSTAYRIPLDGTPIYSHYVRLTHRQWENSVRDLLKLAAAPGLTGTFTGDPPEGTFSNNERALFVTANLRSDYERAAEDLAKRVAGDATARAAIVANGTNAANFIKAFGRRAYRRPLDASEQQRYEALFASAATLYPSGDAFANGVELVVRAMLQSPHFVYRTELGSDNAPLSGWEVASKLSFLLHDTIPSDSLLDAAERGELGTAEGIVKVAQAMLEEPVAVSVIGRYHDELFGMFRYESIEKDRMRFPEYNPAMNAEFAEADRLFFESIYKGGQGLREILLSQTGFVTASTAPLYGVTASGSGLQPVALGPERTGFFTRLGFLAYNANLRDPDPIHRGVDINHRLLCGTLVAPGGVIPQLPPQMAGQTNRERVTAHTGVNTCGAGCHSVIINPLGFSLENFDAIGRKRDMDNGKPVDTADAYALATGLIQFSGAPQLMTLLAEAPETHACYARHLGEFTLARDLGESDRGLVEELTTASVSGAGPIKTMLLAAVRSPRFSTRNGGTQ
jgi:hypothetical protein